MSMKATGIRFPDRVMARLRTLAHQESLRSGSEIHWCDLVREAVDKFLQARSDQPVQDPAPSADASPVECIQF